MLGYILNSDRSGNWNRFSFLVLLGISCRMSFDQFEKKLYFFFWTDIWWFFKIIKYAKDLAKNEKILFFENQLLHGSFKKPAFRGIVPWFIITSYRRKKWCRWVLTTVTLQGVSRASKYFFLSLKFCESNWFCIVGLLWPQVVSNFDDTYKINMYLKEFRRKKKITYFNV